MLIKRNLQNGTFFISVPQSETDLLQNQWGIVSKIMEIEKTTNNVSMSFRTENTNGLSMTKGKNYGERVQLIKDIRK